MDGLTHNRTTEAKEIGSQPYDVYNSKWKLYCAKYFPGDVTFIVNDVDLKTI